MAVDDSQCQSVPVNASVKCQFRKGLAPPAPRPPAPPHARARACGRDRARPKQSSPNSMFNAYMRALERASYISSPKLASPALVTSLGGALS